METQEFRKIARQLVSNRIMVLCGLGLDDLPDTCDVANLIDVVEDILRDNFGGGNNNHLHIAKMYVQKNVGMDFVEELIYY